MQLISGKDRSEVQHNITRSLRDYMRALKDGDGEAASRVIDELPVKAFSLGDIFSKILTPALIEVGDAWCVGEIGPAQEHLATQIVLTQLDRLRRIFGAEGQRSPYRVLVSCVEGEQHVIGARMFADLCLAQGWSVDFLGADVPAIALLDMVRRTHPQILALSATMERGFEIERFVKDLALLPTPPRVILGGQAVIAANTRLSAGDDFAVAFDAGEGFKIAARWQRADRPKTILKDYLTALGRRVRELRTQIGWTQEQLAQATSVTRVCIVAVEGGKQNVSMDIVVRMANALGIKPEVLLSGSEETHRSERRGA